MTVRAKALIGLVALAFAWTPADAGAGGAPSALRTVVEHGLSQLNSDTSQLMKVIAPPIVPGSAAQRNADAAVKRMQSDLARMGVAVAQAVQSSPAAGMLELQAITELETALATLEASLSAGTTKEVISAGGPFKGQLNKALATAKRAARLLGCPKTC